MGLLSFLRKTIGGGPEVRAQASNALDQYSEMAQTHLANQQFDDAARILQQIVESDPSRDQDRLALAMSYWQLEQVALCRHHLSYLSARAISEPIREYARVQLEQYENALGLGQLDRRLASMQEASLQEQVASPTAPASVFTRLARLLLRQGRLSGDSDIYSRVLPLLDVGKQRHPDDASILELLINCYLRYDPEQRLERTIRELELVDPESDVLKTLSRRSPEDDDILRRISERINALFEQATAGESSLRQAALNGMRDIVLNAPNNPHYRVAYAFALLANGFQAEALKHATLLSTEIIEEHALHFNLGQIFWMCGDAERGRRHLELALGYAATNEERQDVLARIRDLESPG